MAQSISGVVYDSKNEPLTGVVVALKGTTNGSITDLEGKFEMNNIPESANNTLVFKCIGFKTVEEQINKKSFFTIIMQDDTQSLDEIVVVGYGTVKKKDLTTAVSSVSTKDLDKRPITSAAQAIQGRSAGIQVVQPSGKPGSEMSIRVRGATSILAKNEPLYVVDGMATDNISFLAPSDIESISILKDASSAAIYGARAANGVVLITTKRGKAGEATVDFNSYLGFSKIGNTLDVLNTQQYGELLQDIDKNSGSRYYDTFISNTESKYKNVNTNWADQTYRTATIQNYQLSISGGNEKDKYLISTSYQREDGVVKPAYFEKYAGRLNLDNQVKKWLSISTNVALSRNITQNTSDNANSGRGGVIMSVLNTPPFLTVWDPDQSQQYAQNPYQPSWENPLAYTQRDENTKINRVLANTSIHISLIDNLKFQANMGADYLSSEWNFFLDNVKTVYGRSGGLNGQAQNRKRNALLIMAEGMFSYNKTIQTDHYISALAGISRQTFREDESYLSAHDFLPNYLGGSMTAANIIDQSSNATSAEWATLSYLAKFNYSYKSKYLLTANFRTDGSSKLNPNKRWGYFPSVSAGWRISSEPFMSFTENYLSDLKLRTGWGINGNQEGIGNYEYLGFWNINRRTATEPLSGPTVSNKTLPNPDLTWETTTQYNIGLDFSFLNSRINFSADAYLKRTKDLLMNITLPSTSNVTEVKRNNGEMENKGLEFELHTVNIDSKLRWESDFNISFNKNKIKKLTIKQDITDAKIETNGSSVIVVREGLALGSFYGLIAEGINPETGDVIYKDLSNNGKIGAEDYTVIGNAQPKFIYGFNNTFSYNNFDLTIFFQGSYGNDIYNASRIDTEGMMDHKNQLTTVLNRWKRPGMETDMPRAGNIENIKNSTRFLEDGSYLRLKSLTLNYNFKEKILKLLHVNRLSVYATATNLLTFTKYSGYDPEVNMGGNSSTILGVDYGTYPQSKSIIFGLNINF